MRRPPRLAFFLHMSFLPILSSEQRQALKECGIPLPLLDEVGGDCFLLLKVEFNSDPQSGGVTARIPTINAFGEGNTREEATLALSAALHQYLEAFS